ncbi:hypothetical protein ACKWTF_016719 [Chironomus riparius]
MVESWPSVPKILGSIPILCPIFEALSQFHRSSYKVLFVPYRTLLTVPYLPSLTYRTLLTVPYLPSLTYRTLLTVPYLPYLTYRTLLTVPYLPYLTYRTLLTVPYLPYLTYDTLLPYLACSPNSITQCCLNFFQSRHTLTLDIFSWLTQGCPTPHQCATAYSLDNTAITSGSIINFIKICVYPYLINLKP